MKGVKLLMFEVYMADWGFIGHVYSSSERGAMTAARLLWGKDKLYSVRKA